MSKIDTGILNPDKIYCFWNRRDAALGRAYYHADSLDELQQVVKAKKQEPVRLCGTAIQATTFPFTMSNAGIYAWLYEADAPELETIEDSPFIEIQDMYKTVMFNVQNATSIRYRHPMNDKDDDFEVEVTLISSDDIFLYFESEIQAKEVYDTLKEKVLGNEA